jgi:hypothetical protein
MIPRRRDAKLHRRLAQTYIDVSIAYRDMRLDLTVTRFRPTDVKDLRNIMLDIIRYLLSLETETSLFNEELDVAIQINIHSPQDSQTSFLQEKPKSSPHQDPSQRVSRLLSLPTRDVFDCIREALSCSHAALIGTFRLSWASRAAFGRLF